MEKNTDLILHTHITYIYIESLNIYLSLTAPLASRAVNGRLAGLSSCEIQIVEGDYFYKNQCILCNVCIPNFLTR